jgi:hypothetical protein
MLMIVVSASLLTVCLAESDLGKSDSSPVRRLHCLLLLLLLLLLLVLLLLLLLLVLAASC